MNASNISYFENYANQKPVLDLRMLLIINVITSSLLLVSHQIEITIGAFLISFVALLIFKMFKQVFWYTLVFLGSIFFCYCTSSLAINSYYYYSFKNFRFICLFCRKNDSFYHDCPCYIYKNFG